MWYIIYKEKIRTENTEPHTGRCSLKADKLLSKSYFSPEI